MNEGLVARYILKPWKRDELETVIDWAFSAYEFAGRDAVLRERLLQTERLVTIGSMTAAVFHDLSQPLALLVSNCERIMQLRAGVPALKRLLEAPNPDLSPEDAALLADLCEDYEPIADDLQQGCDVMADLINNMRRLVRPQNTGQVARTAVLDQPPDAPLPELEHTNAEGRPPNPLPPDRWACEQ